MQLRSYQVMLMLWIIFMLLINGNFGEYLGLKYLFLDPEYMGVVSNFSFFLVGLSLGSFYIVWNLSVYILVSHRFPFLATLERPFSKFSLNNSFVPLVFFIFYITKLVLFQYNFEYKDWNAIVLDIASLMAGLVAALLVSSIYFRFFNKDIIKFKQQLSNAPFSFKNEEHRRLIEHRYLNYKKYEQPEVKFYLNHWFQPKYVRSTDHYSSTVLIKIFRQNHTIGLIFFLATLIILVFLGLNIETPAFRLPTGATCFILASLITSIIGALSFWFKGWSITVFMILLLVADTITKHTEPRTHAAFGLEYSGSPVQYNDYIIQHGVQDSILEEDKAKQLLVLENWLKKNTVNGEKPTMIFLCTSGGGLKAAVWSFSTMQFLDSITGGRFFEHTHLITGASGGMMGASFYRELALRKKLYRNINLNDRLYTNAISKDLQGPTSYAMVVNDIFLKKWSFEYEGQKYYKDRGYIFERALNENTFSAFDHPYSYYRPYEQVADIPSMVLSPIILNDHRKLILSNMPASFLCKPLLGQVTSEIEIDGVEFGRLFKEKNADKLVTSSALRMNATYPYILPTISLPTSPTTYIADAGYRDNFGISLTTRYIDNFSDWIQKNTAGVIIVQMRVSDKYDPIDNLNKISLFDQLLSPLGTALKFQKIQDFNFDDQISYLKDKLGKEYLKVYHLTYQPNQQNQKASMSFHLTKNETEDIISAVHNPNNQHSIQQIVNAIE